MKSNLLILICLTIVVYTKQSHSKTSIEDRVLLLTQLIEEQRELYKIPGLAIAVVKDGKTILTQGFGVKNIEKGQLVEADTLFPINSISKSFTAVLTGIRVDEGAMAWDDPIAQFLPDYRFYHQGELVPITLRDALSHRSGYARNDTLWSQERVPRLEILKAATKAMPLDDYQAKFHYNNVMYLAAGMATAYDKSFNWDKLLQEKLLTPLGMNSTTTDHLRVVNDPRLSTGYYWHEIEKQFYDFPLRNVHNIAPATGVYSNANDMAKWITFLLKKGVSEDRQLIQEETLKEIYAPVISISDTYSYAMGLNIAEYDGEVLIEHAGNGEGHAAQFALLPESGIGFVLLTNVAITPLQTSSIQLVFDTLLKDVITPEEDQIKMDYSKYLGNYTANFWQFKNSDFSFKMQGKKPAIKIPGQSLYMLKPPNEEGKFYFEVTDKVAISFNFNEQNQVVSMNHHEQGQTFILPKVEQTSLRQSKNNAKSQDDGQSLSKIMHVEQQRLAIRALGEIKLTGTLLQEQSGVTGVFEVVVASKLDWHIKQDFGQFGYIETIASSGSGMNKRLRHSYPLKDILYEQALREHPFNFLYWDKIYESVSINRETGNENNITAVLAGFNASNVTAKINKKTGFVNQIAMYFVDPVWGEYPRSISYFDYEPFCGVNIPRKFEINDHETGITVFTIKELTTKFCPK
jgi:CubicO group peptidase (beta-lactamase class C family)